MSKAGFPMLPLAAAFASGLSFGLVVLLAAPLFRFRRSARSGRHTPHYDNHGAE